MSGSRPEAQLQKTIVQLLTLTGGPGMVFFSIPNEGKRTLAGGAELRRMGLRAGVKAQVTPFSLHGFGTPPSAFDPVQ